MTHQDGIEKRISSEMRGRGAMRGEITQWRWGGDRASDSVGGDDDGGDGEGNSFSRGLQAVTLCLSFQTSLWSFLVLADGVDKVEQFIYDSLSPSLSLSHRCVSLCL